jgi:hypothetical protein
MPGHCIEDDQKFEDDVREENRDLCVLNLMLCDSPCPWTVDEIACELHAYRCGGRCRQALRYGTRPSLWGVCVPNARSTPR